MPALVLDAQALSELVRRGSAERQVRDAVQAAIDEGTDIVVPAAVLAELYRGGHHDQELDSYLSRGAPMEIIDTDRGLAKRVGQILAAAGRGSEDHVDATVVAACVQQGGGLIITGDPRDMRALTAPLGTALVHVEAV